MTSIDYGGGKCALSQGRKKPVKTFDPPAYMLTKKAIVLQCRISCLSFKRGECFEEARHPARVRQSEIIQWWSNVFAFGRWAISIRKETLLRNIKKDPHFCLLVGRGAQTYLREDKHCNFRAKYLTCRNACGSSWEVGWTAWSAAYCLLASCIYARLLLIYTRLIIILIIILLLLFPPKSLIY